jgi:hypothetical protein
MQAINEITTTKYNGAVFVENSEFVEYSNNFSNALGCFLIKHCNIKITQLTPFNFEASYNDNGKIYSICGNKPSSIATDLVLRYQKIMGIKIIRRD